MRVMISAPYMIPLLDRFLPVFEEHGVEVVVPDVDERLDEGTLLSLIVGIDGVICGDDAYTARVMERADRLKVISKWGTGIDSIDTDAADRFGVKVCNTPNAFTEPVADTVLGYVLSFARNLPWMDDHMRAGRWEKIPGHALHERTLGVVGVGNIGKAVVRRARAFGMTVLGNDIAEIDRPFQEEQGFVVTGLDDLLETSDFVSLNCDLNPTSYHLIGEHELELMKPTAYLVNTARGPVVDNDALAAALTMGGIGGAALDVFETEPLPHDHPLLACERCLFAPHNANSSPTAWERVHRNTLTNLFRVLLPEAQLTIPGPGEA